MTSLSTFLLETQLKYDQKNNLNSERSHHTKVFCTDLYALVSDKPHIQGPSQFICTSGLFHYEVFSSIFD